jgi:hypothetical protein
MMSVSRFSAPTVIAVIVVPNCQWMVTAAWTCRCWLSLPWTIVVVDDVFAEWWALVAVPDDGCAGSWLKLNVI